jgi:hypothetical protein
MTYLLETHSEAMQFCQSVIDNVADYKLNEDETFKDLRPCVLASTSVDSHNEALHISSLRGLIEYVENNPYWLNVEHDPLIHPQGRILAAKIFHSADTDIYFVAGVIGYYDSSAIKSFNDVGISSFDFDDKIDLDKFNDEVEIVHIAFNPIEIKNEFIQELIANSPELVNKEPRRSIRKELEPITIITIVATAGILLKPLLAKFGEKIGEKSAEEVSEFYDWLKTKVFKKIKEIENPRFRFEFFFEYESAYVKFVVPSKEELILCEAADNISEATELAIILIDKLQEFEPEKLIFEFNLETRKWNPSYLATKKIGIISDKPTLMALDKMQGLSVGGIIAGEKGNTIIKRK